MSDFFGGIQVVGKVGVEWRWRVVGVARGREESVALRHESDRASVAVLAALAFALCPAVLYLTARVFEITVANATRCGGVWATATGPSAPTNPSGGGRG